MQHISVLLTSAIEALAVDPQGIYIDATFGRGGHTQALLDRLGPAGRIYAIDQDPAAIVVAHEIFENEQRVTVQHGSFSYLANYCQRWGITQQVNGVLADLGVSSPQLDDAGRGFSFQQDGPLDMRMDTSQGQTAAEWLAEVDEKTLADVLWQYGEERQSRRIARAIVNDRTETPFTTTLQLASLVSRVVRGKHNKHPATRTFQAIRIHINKELQSLNDFLQQTVDVMAPEGRLAVISFHSLEDRQVKRFIRQASQATQVPAHIPLTEAQIQAQSQAQLKPIGRAIKPDLSELQANPRARSAVLRVAERIVQAARAN